MDLDTWGGWISAQGGGVVGFHVIPPSGHPVEWRNRAIAAERRLTESRSIALGNARFDEILAPAVASGAAVNPSTALTVSGVYACVRLLSDMVSTLPIYLYRQTKRGYERDNEHHAARLVMRPRGAHGSFELRRQVMTGALLGGNGYAHVERSAPGGPATKIRWVPPGDVSPYKRPNTNEVFYRVSGLREDVSAGDIIHVKTLSICHEGILGVSPIRQMRESIGTSIAQRDAAGKMMSNGARFGGIIKAPPTMKEEQVKKLREEWRRSQEGPENAGKTPILWGAEWQSVGGMTAADAQFLESRVFELREIARWYGIPPILIGDNDSATFAGAGIESLFRAFRAVCLSSWLTQWEEQLNDALLTERELDEGMNFEFERKQIEAITLKDQADFVARMRTATVFSPNDGLEFLGYPRSDEAGMNDVRAPLNSSSTGAPSEAAQPDKPVSA